MAVNAVTQPGSQIQTKLNVYLKLDTAQPCGSEIFFFMFCIVLISHILTLTNFL